MLGGGTQRHALLHYQGELIKIFKCNLEWKLNPQPVAVPRSFGTYTLVLLRHNWPEYSIVVMYIYLFRLEIMVKLMTR